MIASEENTCGEMSQIVITQILPNTMGTASTYTCELYNLYNARCR